MSLGFLWHSMHVVFCSRRHMPALLPFGVLKQATALTSTLSILLVVAGYQWEYVFD